MATILLFNGVGKKERNEEGEGNTFLLVLHLVYYEY